MPVLADYPNIKRARRLRKKANAPEQVAWQTLRKLREQGYAVRRQYPIDKYVVDFVILKAKLVIEIDGGIHALEEVVERDQIRDEALSSLGWKILRIPAEVAMSPEVLMGQVQKQLGL